MMPKSEAENPYPVEPAVNCGKLPDIFARDDGRRVQARAEWADRARAWRDLIVNMEYGGMPPAPGSLEVEQLCRSAVKRWPDSPHLWSYRIHCRGGKQPFSFCLRILLPRDGGPFPVIVNGDGCWWYISEAVAQRVVERGCALVMFNRTEMAEDPSDRGVPRRSGGLYDIYPGLDFGALSAWAWGYHRCVDTLLQMEDVFHPRQIAVTGHSRGGKTALLAGLTDERITLVNDNAGGIGGGATFRYVGHGGETLARILDTFPAWFNPGAGLRAFTGNEEAAPFDHHCLLAAIAPRLLLLTYALDDRWSNPEGMIQSVWAAREAYRFLDAEDRLAFHLRPGPHRHSQEDWDVLLDFIGRHWQGREAGAVFNRHPYIHLQPAFSWQAPA